MRRAIAALVQAFAGGIDAERRDVFHYRKLYLIRFGGFGKPLDAVNAFQPLDYCFLYYFLAVGNRKQL